VSSQPSARGEAAGDKQYSRGHIAALRRFSIGITVITIVGHAFLGFEQSYAQPLVALAAAYGMQILLELADAWSNRRQPRFIGSVGKFVDFMLSAHISGLAVAMLLFYNDRLWVVAFASATAIGSKAVFRAPYGAGTRHVFNPSNFGISATLLLFPWVGLTMPWQFTRNLTGLGDWIVPLIIIGLGTFLNGVYTKRLPAILTFLACFILQAVLRSLLLGWPLIPSLAPATGPAAVIYTFFMLPDPATTPDRIRSQILFGASVAGLYAVFVMLHIVFGLFFALTVVCAVRGAWLWFAFLRRRTSLHPSLSTAPA
jgi:hypothetical protein